MQVTKLQTDLSTKEADYEELVKDRDFQKKLVQKRFDWGKKQKAENVKALKELEKSKEAQQAAEKALADMREEYQKSAGPADQYVAWAYLMDPEEKKKRWSHFQGRNTIFSR